MPCMNGGSMKLMDEPWLGACPSSVKAFKRASVRLKCFEREVFTEEAGTHARCCNRVA